MIRWRNAAASIKLLAGGSSLLGSVTPGAVPGYAYIAFFAVCVAFSSTALVTVWLPVGSFATAGFLVVLLGWACIVACPLY